MLIMRWKIVTRQNTLLVWSYLQKLRTLEIRVSFEAILTLNDSNVFLQSISTFYGVSLILLPIKRVKSPKPQCWGMNRHFQTKCIHRVSRQDLFSTDLKFRIFKNPRWLRPPCWKNRKKQLYLSDGSNTDTSKSWSNNIVALIEIRFYFQCNIMILPRLIKLKLDLNNVWFKV